MAARAPAVLPVRLGVFVAGVGALLYAVLVLAVVPQPLALERASARIAMGDRYRAEELDRLSGLAADLAAAPLMRATSLRAAALVALRQAETATDDGRRADIDTHMDALARRVPAALAAAPADPFLWLALFWRDNVAEGFQETRLPLLAMSYATGPYEGWVGVKRSVVTLALWGRLTPALQAAAAEEFVGLVQSRFREMPEILTGPGWEARHVLLPRMADLDQRLRREFARTLNRAGVDVKVPGIERPSIRPWVP
ncbi:hypothetical protein RA307_17775 [Xanthobacteraceae bacterium Astr-EGSB]|uniref:hypothetical protein n=1 Tax=Astrobacterium formosum TaxID=3069710 RepID=UPI0027B2AA28|nr:hypothetical protein [Xanthobacteraceae bacterium Astr-EGSB]